jgi:hypothetical protein
MGLLIVLSKALGIEIHYQGQDIHIHRKGLVFELPPPGSEFVALPGEAAVLMSRLLEEPLDRTSILIFLTTDNGHDSWNVIGY